MTQPALNSKSPSVTAGNQLSGLPAPSVAKAIGRDASQGNRDTLPANRGTLPGNRRILLGLKATRIEISVVLTAALLILMLGGLVVGANVAKPVQYFVLGGAFLAAWAASASGIWARRVAERAELAIGDFIGFLAIVFGQFVALCFFLNLAHLLLPSGVALAVFWGWFALLVLYAFASAVPAVRLIMVCAIFIGVPLSMLAVHLVHQRDAARQNVGDKNATEIYRGFRHLRDIQRK